MATTLTRRVLNPRFLHLLSKSASHLAPSPTPKPFISSPTYYYKPTSHLFFLTCRTLSSTPPPDPSSAGTGTDTGPETFKHQEIEGPTVERDLSPLANETRQVLDKMRKSIHNLSTVLALLGVAHLGLGAWVVYTTPQGSPQEISYQAITAFVFPVAAAFLMRHSLKAMVFFNKMEEMGRLQILTSVMQQVKWLDLMLRRTRVVGVCCILGMSAGTLVAVSKR
ncbi:Class E basic helix-loop-helix protein 22 [Rhynchospora pubera]|uniref:Class E basic helix-loop-helix protein 22 n=1 Tax=Rhynchospora pubera TaxID=906938 RepID=A0AAV8BCV7_9POAL|nr:Class E basic helix-loop-helix protein 22 [Rhynchospora pubera]KAJ4793890.1 Class E basic helix-loop-helix protein 22 [Rhynchospora pubera]